jgi:hypothetical protein
MKLYVWAVLACWGGLGLTQAAPPPQVELRQNYPNPFNPATTIPFGLNGELFANGHRPKVSLKIYNVLAQLVATPILQGTGEDLENVELMCSTPSSGCTFNAYWDGNVLKSDKQAASGVYIYQLVVDGKRFTKKMIVMK